MPRAACHCTAVRLELSYTPEWVLDCNCTLCRRYGGLWTYPEPGQVTLVTGEGATDTYSWLDHELIMHRCKTCGCTTHFVVAGTDPPRIYGVNARMIPTLDPGKVRIRRRNNSHTGWFWTRPDAPIEPSNHPEMPMPGPDDWR
jgi:hypothetical protein